MSLVVNTTTPEGIVLAADSRQSYVNLRNMARIGSDNASKLFQLNRRIGVAVTGIAFLEETGTLKNISKFIEEFKRETDVETLSVKELADKLHDLFNTKYKWETLMKELIENVKNDLISKGCEILNIEEHPPTIKIEFKNAQGNKENIVTGIDNIDILIAGYNQDGSHEVYSCTTPGKIQERRNSKKQNMEYGSDWLGQVDVVSRIVLGYDGRITNAPFVNDAIIINGEDQIFSQLQGLEYVIQWGTMTIQDAIDFCTLMIQTTSAIQRFSDGINAIPGDMPGVGGPIDLAVITPDKGFVWINKKKLKFEGNELDLDKEIDLEDLI